MKTQILHIHGGETFETYEDYFKFLKEDFKIESLDYFKRVKWIDTLEEKLGNDFEVINPRMPNNLNSKYSEWKVYFEKILPFLNQDIILMGYSLGGIFLTKYLSENKLNKNVLNVFIISAPFDDSESEYKLADFNLTNNLRDIEKTVDSSKIYFFHSEDDEAVSVKSFYKYKNLLPNANYILLQNRGHINQPEFPELVDLILKLKQ